RVHHGVEVREVHDVVHVPVGIVVHPPRGDRQRVRIVRATLRLGARHQPSASFPAVAASCTGDWNGRAVRAKAPGTIDSPPEMNDSTSSRRLSVSWYPSSISSRQ